MCGCFSCTLYWGDLTCNPGMCPDWELNRRHFGSQSALNPLSYTSQGVLISFQHITTSGITGSCGNSIFFFWGFYTLFSIIATPTMHKGFFISTSLPTFISCLFDDGHSNRCEVVGAYNFNGSYPLSHGLGWWLWRWRLESRTRLAVIVS